MHIQPTAQSYAMKAVYIPGKRVWPVALEDSRELLLDRMLLMQGLQLTKVTSSNHSTVRERWALFLSQEGIPLKTLLPDCFLWGYHSGSFSSKT